MEDEDHRVLGTLCLLSPIHQLLPESQRSGLKLLADHVRTIVTRDRRKIESNQSTDHPVDEAFVRGLVHELGSFIFGISASLDAFVARFAIQEEVGNCGTNTRRNLDRMSDFLVELREYGCPQRPSLSMHGLGPLLQEAVEQCRFMAGERHVIFSLNRGFLAIHPCRQAEFPGNLRPLVGTRPATSGIRLLRDSSSSSPPVR